MEHVGPQEFFVIVSTMRADAMTDAEVLTRTAASRAQAEVLRDDLMQEIGAAIQAPGDRVFTVTV